MNNCNLTTNKIEQVQEGKTVLFAVRCLPSADSTQDTTRTTTAEQTNVVCWTKRV